jgi:hypothetical protein
MVFILDSYANEITIKEKRTALNKLDGISPTPTPPPPRPTMTNTTFLSPHHLKTISPPTTNKHHTSLGGARHLQ